MRIVLLYPPPWKIAPAGHIPYPGGEGAPREADPLAVDGGDFSQAPYGLLSIASQAIEADHQVTVLNLSTFPWNEVEYVTDRLQADLYGLSCHTANRRGVAMLAKWIRRRHPGAHIVVGGPHVTALPGEILNHHPAIDTVIIGEGESSFMELVRCIEEGGTAGGVPGTASRGAKGVAIAPPRPPIADLDSLASPADHFSLRTLVTSRGCPGRCTFCASRLMWSGHLRFHSAAYVLDMVEKSVYRHGHRYLAFKDDTFTADRQRVITICEEISRRRIGCNWSCETRADRLDPELLAYLHRAGCRRISIGVESASPQILKNIRKNVSLDKVLEATRAARNAGIEVRFYMMVGNRGETYHTFREGLDFIKLAEPNQFVFCQLHLYPGTEEFEIFQRNGCVTPEIFFTSDFACLTCFAGQSADLEKIMPELRRLEGVRSVRPYGIEACETAGFETIRFPEQPEGPGPIDIPA